MSEKSTAVHIARRHQSAPKETELDRAVKTAATEISEGKYIPDDAGEGLLDGLGLALGAGTSGVAVGEKPTLEDFRATREMNELGRHPRVLEAIAKAEQEMEAAADPYLEMERSWMLHEMTAEQVKKNKWDGQERWEDKDAEDRAIGRILTPMAFHAQLCTVIGNERVLLSPHAVKERPSDKAARVGLYVKNPAWDGVSRILGDSPAIEAGKLREQGEKKLREAKSLRAAGMTALADKAQAMAYEMALTAGGMLMEQTAREAANPELLRVGMLQWPCGSEWMVMHFDMYGVPKCAKYIGWRTALLTMVRCAAITEVEAHKAFPVGSGNAANWYLEQLYRIRNPSERVN
jgi:hypothetical protein